MFGSGEEGRSGEGGWLWVYNNCNEENKIDW